MYILNKSSPSYILYIKFRERKFDSLSNSGKTGVLHRKNIYCVEIRQLKIANGVNITHRSQHET